MIPLYALRLNATGVVSVCLMRGLYGSGLCHVLRYAFPPARSNVFMKLLRTLNLRKIRSEHRLALEMEVMPRYLPPAGGNVLLVGHEICNLHYPLYYLGTNVRIIDPVAKNRRMSVRATFIADRVAMIGQYMPAESVDVCQCNGVYGWGLDAEPELRESLQAMHGAMKTGGVLIFGHNVKTHNPLSLGDNENTRRLFAEYGFVEAVSGPVPRFGPDYSIRVFHKG